MDKKHEETLAADSKEVFSINKRIEIKLKSFIYFFGRIVFDLFFRVRGYKRLATKDGVGCVDRFLRDDGGLFKSVVYTLCNQLAQIKGKDILVPGVGYGRNLFQLASFGPKKIIGFDLYEYPEEWEYMSKKLKEKFGTEVIFRKGGFAEMGDIKDSSFDWIISDAVLEHVSDMKDFMEESKRLLKNGGNFYASFGPIWYGPRGDHMDWGVQKRYNHLLLEEDKYLEDVNRIGARELGDSIEGVFLIKNKLFSYLRLGEYFNFFRQSNFVSKRIFIKMDSSAKEELKDIKIKRLLDYKSVPGFDRLASGAYVWLENRK